MLNKNEGLKLLKAALSYAVYNKLAFGSAYSLIAPLCLAFNIPLDDVRIDLSDESGDQNLSFLDLLSNNDSNEKTTDFFNNHPEPLLRLNCFRLPEGDAPTQNGLPMSHALFQENKLLASASLDAKQIDWQVIQNPPVYQSIFAVKQDDILPLLIEMFKYAWHQKISFLTIFQFLALSCFKHGIHLAAIKWQDVNGATYNIFNFAAERIKDAEAVKLLTNLSQKPALKNLVLEPIKNSSQTETKTPTPSLTSQTPDSVSSQNDRSNSLLGGASHSPLNFKVFSENPRTPKPVSFQLPVEHLKNMNLQYWLDFIRAALKILRRDKAAEENCSFLVQDLLVAIKTGKLPTTASITKRNEFYLHDRYPDSDNTTGVKTIKKVELKYDPSAIYSNVQNNPSDKITIPMKKANRDNLPQILLEEAKRHKGLIFGRVILCSYSSGADHVLVYIANLEQVKFIEPQWFDEKSNKFILDDLNRYAFISGDVPEDNEEEDYLPQVFYLVEAPPILGSPAVNPNNDNKKQEEVDDAMTAPTAKI